MRLEKYIKKLYIFSAPSAPINIDSILWYYLLIYNVLYIFRSAYITFSYMIRIPQNDIYICAYIKKLYNYKSLEITLVTTKT